jgi:wyosine [tRNA(Phe)-imidazoG37] synthetase (radical SAM superfamily)
VVGGPVCTRTGARSLRVSLLPPGGRICGFECRYCGFAPAEGPACWPRAGDVGCAVAHALDRDPQLRSITLSGPGEPTLHPGFGRALAEVIAARGGRADLPVRVATNGATLVDPRIRRLLGFADERIVRLDAGGDRIARPRPGLGRQEIAEALRGLPGFSAESVFVEGAEGNVGDADLEAWMALLGGLRPGRVYVTTIARPPATPGLGAAGSATLERIAAALRARTGLAAGVVR